VKREREVRRREESEGFDEDVGDGLFLGKEGVELVAASHPIQMETR
jgi:hypothetical protein